VVIPSFLDLHKRRSKFQSANYVSLALS